MSATIIDLAVGRPDVTMWAARPEETIWAPEWVVITPGQRGAGLRTLRALPPPDDMFWITERGPVFIYGTNPAQDLWNPDALVNTWVVIDSGLYQVAGVESHRPMISPTSPYGDRPIGILVRPMTKLARESV